MPNHPHNRHILITGGAGFIGVNSARYIAERGWRVTVLDNLSRRGTADNLHWLQQQADVGFERCDVRGREALEAAVAAARPDVLLHLAGQVAATTSVTNPREDFEINALGTFNILEAVRRHSPETFVINASTSKVYGKLEDVTVTERDGRYEYRDLTQGVSDRQQLDFHSPYARSLRGLFADLEHRLRISIQQPSADWRSGVQPVFRCNLEKAEDWFLWQPSLGVGCMA